MEADQPAPENPDQATSDEQGASPARSYECTFCKRGFSNAQALGGHMNIHRRDKAKLKQNETSQQSFDVPKSIPSYSPNHPSCTSVQLQSMADARPSQARSSPGNWPWVIPNDDDDAIKRGKTSCHVGEVRQLTLFDEKPSITDQNPSSTRVQESQGSSGADQLDLELRLGPEPDSSSTMTTKKFF